jgi:hypothetical protein
VEVTIGDHKRNEDLREEIQINNSTDLQTIDLYCGNMLQA